MHKSDGNSGLISVEVSQLQPGMMVSRVISQSGPVKIRQVGMIRSAEMIKGLTRMGVTEVEVNVDQSVGIEVETSQQDQQPTQLSSVAQGDSSNNLDDSLNQSGVTDALTPTQQLLKNEREIAKASNGVEQQYHRTLFMPSVDALPNSWQLYGRGSMILSLLVVGGLCFGWNLANLGTWASLLQYEKPVQAQYDASELLALQALLTANGQEPSAMQEPSATKEPSARKEPSVEGKPSTQNEPSTEQLASGAQNLTASTESATSSDAASAADDPKPIVLGYQGGRIIDVDELSRESSANNVLNEDNSVNTPLDPISLDLLNRVNQAAAQIDGSDDLTSVDSSNFQNNEGTQSAVSPQTSYKDLPRIDQLSIALQTEIPSMSFSAHLYSSQAENRWVRVNGRRLMEGDYIAEGLQLVNIEPQTVILGFKGEVFTMNALTDW